MCGVRVFLVYSPGLCGIGEDDSLRDAMLLCAWFTTRTVDKSTIKPTDPIVVVPGNSSIAHLFAGNENLGRGNDDWVGGWMMNSINHIRYIGHKP